MKARYRYLCEHSLHTTLSAIEVYNKPDFKEREQIFAILMVTAWETLFKAKILKDHRNKLHTLYVREGMHYKRNRSGQLLTIGIQEAMSRCHVSPVVAENISRLIEIRDAAIHLTAASASLPYLTFILGSATLRNYALLIRRWFTTRLNDYNFYILPLGFDYPFHTISAVDLKKEPEDIARIIQTIADAQTDQEQHDNDFHLICELRTTMVSAKKISEETDLVAKVDQQSQAGIIVTREIRLIDKYPYTYRQILQKLKEIHPMVKPSVLNTLIKTFQIKGNGRYSTYHYRSKTEEKVGPSKSTQVLYNEEFFQLARVELCEHPQ